MISILTCKLMSVCVKEGVKEKFPVGVFSVDYKEI